MVYFFCEFIYCSVLCLPSSVSSGVSVSAPQHVISVDDVDEDVPLMVGSDLFGWQFRAAILLTL